MTAITGPGVPVTHDAAPVPGTAYTVGGPLVNYPADERLERSFPMEAHCCGCPEMVRRESKDVPWEHTGRKPGDSI